MKFTLDEAITIQAQHLQNWKLLLNDRAYAMLEAICIKDNSIATIPFDIPRGQTLYEILQNIVLPCLLVSPSNQ